MKPYSYDKEICGRKCTGCCPGHDWPVCYRWCGKHSSPGAKRKQAQYNKQGKRRRRRSNKQSLRLDSE